MTADRVTAKGMPPNSMPTSISVPTGTYRAISIATSPSNVGSDARRYSSKYSSITWPFGRWNAPCWHAVNRKRVIKLGGSSSASSHERRIESSWPSPGPKESGQFPLERGQARDLTEESE